jgi:hypothetical protein
MFVVSQRSAEYLSSHNAVLIGPFPCLPHLYDVISQSAGNWMQALRAEWLRTIESSQSQLLISECACFVGPDRSQMAAYASSVALKPAARVVIQWDGLTATTLAVATLVVNKWRHFLMSLS